MDFHKIFKIKKSSFLLLIIVFFLFLTSLSEKLNDLGAVYYIEGVFIGFITMFFIHIVRVNKGYTFCKNSAIIIPICILVYVIGIPFLSHLIYSNIGTTFKLESTFIFGKILTISSFLFISSMGFLGRKQ